MRASSPAATLAALTLVACGGDERASFGREPKAIAKPPASPRVKPAECNPDVAGCRVASGRVLYVEAIDPDGDGDAHLVLASVDSVTAPGVSVVDVAAHLRPDPLPSTGELVSAAGPVHRGSYGQRQIEAIELNLAPRTMP